MFNPISIILAGVLVSTAILVDGFLTREDADKVYDACVFLYGKDTDLAPSSRKQLVSYIEEQQLLPHNLRDKKLDVYAGMLFACGEKLK